MKTIINWDDATVTIERSGHSETWPMASDAGFQAASRAWLRCGWDAKHVYSFTWMGRPIIQLPEDMLRLQEVIYALKPDVIIETGIAHGGSLIFYASLCKSMGRGRVIGIDVDIRLPNRKAIEAHELFADYITMFEGSSIADDIVRAVKAEITPSDSVLILLDSNHTKDHVLAELETYAPMVSKGSYIVATDGIMGMLTGAPRTQSDWEWNNPESAAKEFLARCPDFISEVAEFRFNEGSVKSPVTYWPGAWLKRIR